MNRVDKPSHHGLFQHGMLDMVLEKVCLDAPMIEALYLSGFMLAGEFYLVR